MRTFIIATACVAATVLVVEPAAGAYHLPSNKDRTIVPGKSLGGVRLGMTGAQAVKTWGESRCAEAQDILCVYEPGNSSTNYYLGSTQFTLVKGKVKELAIRLPFDTSGAHDPQFRGPLLKYKINKKIGLGSTLDKVKAAYKGLKVSYRSGSYVSYDLKASKTVKTTFQFFKHGLTYKLNRLEIVKK